jgi:regulator of sigma E protease
MVVICAGVVMNVLLAIFIFWSIHYIRGSYLQETTDIGYVVEGSGAAKAGLRAGDRILAINGKPVHHWEEVQTVMYIENLGNDITLALDRHGRDTSLMIPARTLKSPSDNQPEISVAHTIAAIDMVETGMPADRLGLKAGDILDSLNGQAAQWPIVIPMIKQHAGKTILLVWKRGEQSLRGTTTVTPEGRIGIRLGGRYIGPSRQIKYTLLQALPEGLNDIRQSVVLFALTVGKIATGKTSVKESFGGPVAIAQLATQSADAGLLVFIWFMAQLSMSLAILNILPIPALDGGHLLMLAIEQLIGRELPHRVKIAIQQVGFILLLAFMAFIIYNDISKF